MTNPPWVRTRYGVESSNDVSDVCADSQREDRFISSKYPRRCLVVPLPVYTVYIYRSEIGGRRPFYEIRRRVVYIEPETLSALYERRHVFYWSASNIRVRFPYLVSVRISRSRRRGEGFVKFRA